MRDLLWRCDEHRGPDADFPALRGKRVADADPPACDLEHSSEASGRRDHGRRPRVDGVDDFRAIDSLQIDPAPRGAVRKEMTDGSISSVLAGMPALG
jgi:hypothetical protein